MKALFVNPYIYDFTAYDLWLRPLGLMYAAAVVKKYSDVDVYWIDTLDRFQDPDATSSKPDGRGKFHRLIVDKPDLYKTVPRHYARYGMPLESFCQQLKELPEMDLIFVTSLMTYWIDGITFTLNLLRERFPRAHVVLGGILPTLVPGFIAEAVSADLFISGYGEDAILRIIAEQGGKVYDHPDLADIDRLPYPAVEFLGTQRFLPLLTSRGCPFRCTYCASDLLNPRFSERSADGILDEIYARVRRFNTEHFIIFDDALLVHKTKRFFKVFRKVSRELRLHFHTPNGIHVREIDPGTAELLIDSGFRMLRLSFESTDSVILGKSSGKVTVWQMEQAVKNLEQAGYKRGDLECYLLFGLPGQASRDIESALHFVRDLGIVPHLASYSPVPGTPDFLGLQRQGILSTPVNLYETNKIYYLYQKSGLSHEEILRIKELTAQISRANRAQ